MPLSLLDLMRGGAAASERGPQGVLTFMNHHVTAGNLLVSPTHPDVLTKPLIVVISKWRYADDPDSPSFGSWGYADIIGARSCQLSPKDMSTSLGRHFSELMTLLETDSLYFFQP